MKVIRKRHYDIISALVPEERKAEVIAKVDELLDQLEERYKGADTDTAFAGTHSG